MLVFTCNVCRTSLTAEDQQAGQLVRCPTCRSTLRVPMPAAAALEADLAHTQSPQAAARPPAPPKTQNPFTPQLNRAAPPGRRYGFNCGYCSSRLEANEAMAAQEGQCPTCGNNITIPILDRYGRLIDPKTHQIIKQDPHPVHAYAAAGERAPAIYRTADGKQQIKCPRCGNSNPISSNNCKSCGMPFTMEGTTLEASGTSNGYAVASLVLGIIAIPAGCLVVPPILAIIFGIVGLNQINSRGVDGSGRGMAIAGIVLGGIGCIIAAAYNLR